MPQSIASEDVLNPAQMDAVTTLKGPLQVIAGAGSGKTRTLVYRVARLIETGVPPEAILLLTFTRKAAQEMLERAAELSDARCRMVSGGTFHSLAYKVLKEYAPKLGFPRSFTILDRSDMEEVIGSLLPELGLPKGAPRFPKRSTLATMLSKAANLQHPVETLLLEEFAQFTEYSKEIGRLGALYAGYKREHGMMDYDDLIRHLQTLLEEHPDVRRILSNRYQYIMVDEYQDTNGIQADIVSRLAESHRNVMVVGDDAQSIYSFRGADYRNMFDFPERFPDAKQVKLEQNYRSTQPILDLTNALMDQAGQRFTKCLFTRRTGGTAPRIVNTRTEPEQALFVCRMIREQLQSGRSVTDLAVLFRAGFHSFELEAELTRQQMAYVKYGGFKFLESAHIKDFLAHLRITASRDDAVSWMRALRLVKNVGHAKSRAILHWMREQGAAPEQLGAWPKITARDKGLSSLAALMAQLKPLGEHPKAACDAVMAYYLPILKEKFDDHPKRRKDLEQLCTMAERYGRVKGFIDDLILDPPASSRDMASAGSTPALTLSTVHSAKGLEWPVVILIWVSEGRFPPLRAYRNPAELEEERRLLYVAATRAKDELIFCHPGEEAQVRFPAGPVAGGRAGLSSFLQALPPSLVAGGRSERLAPGGRWGGASLPEAGDLAPPPENSEAGDGAPFRQGDRVRHPAFGPGVISKRPDSDKVEVIFRNGGRKLLHLAYTTLERC